MVIHCILNDYIKQELSRMNETSVNEALEILYVAITTLKST